MRRDVTRQRGVALGELIVAGLLLALFFLAALPAYRRGVGSARSALAIANVRRLYDGAAAYYEAQGRPPRSPELPRFLRSQAPTPPPGACCAQRGLVCAPNPAGWEAPTWRALGFTIDEPHAYWYAAARIFGDGREPGDQYDLTARGDVDCNNIYSTFRRSARVGPRGELAGLPLEVFNTEE